MDIFLFPIHGRFFSFSLFFTLAYTCSLNCSTEVCRTIEADGAVSPLVSIIKSAAISDILMEKVQLPLTFHIFVVGRRIVWTANLQL